MEAVKTTQSSWNEGRTLITSIRAEYADGSTLESFCSIDEENAVRRWNVRTYVDGPLVVSEERNHLGEFLRRREITLREREGMRDYLSENATESGGVYRWTAVDRVVPIDCLTIASLEISEAHREARELEIRASLDAYRRARARMTDEERAEERAEMSAAFGEGETVVDVITGERFEL
jgi:hypothetical protein